MADNVTLNPGASGDVMAADDVSGVKYQIVKLAVGADGAASLVANANPIPISDAGGSVTVDGTVAVSGTVTVDTELPAAAALADNAANPTAPAVGAFGMCWDGSTWDRMPGTSADGVLVNLGANNDVSCSQSGTWNITNVSGTVSLPTGASTAANQATGNASLATIAGAVAGTEVQVDIVSAPTLTVDLGVNNDVTVTGTVTADTELPAAAALADNTANPTAPAVGSFGMVWDGATWDRAPGTAADGALVNLGSNNDVTVSGTVTANLSATDNAVLDAIQAAVELIDNAISGSEIQADIVAALPAGANLIGSVTAAGAAAHGAAVSGNPVLVGLEARTTNPTAVDSGDVVRPYADKLGKQVVLMGALHELDVDGNSNMTDTNADDIIAAGGSGTRIRVTWAVITNRHATQDATVTLRDNTTAKIPVFCKADGGGAVISNPKGLFTCADNVAATAISSASADILVAMGGYYITT